MRKQVVQFLVLIFSVLAVRCSNLEHNVEASCPGTFTRGAIHTTGFPLKNYGKNQDCKWKICAPEGKGINLVFSTIRMHDSAPCSDGDHVAVYSGTDESVQKGLFCGNHGTFEMRVYDSNAVVRFHSDANLTDWGFLAQVEYFDMDPETPEPIQANITGSCIGTFDLIPMEIYSPNYPQTYPANKECSWNINVPAGYGINLKFLYFNTEYAQNCNDGDLVTIYEGQTSQDNREYDLCGEKIPFTVSVTGQNAHIQFKSNGKNEARGFRAQVETFQVVTKMDCKDTYDVEKMQLISPNFPNNYPSNTQCTWLITAPFGHLVKAVFSDFQVGDSSNCSEGDHLNVHDGFLEGSVVWDLCSSKSSFAKLTTQEKGLIKLYSYEKSHFKGFKLTFEFERKVETTCPYTLSTKWFAFNSPGNPGEYPLNVDCTWRIRGAPNEKIKVQFFWFELEGPDAGGQCAKDYVKMYDARDDSGSPTVVKCGAQDYFEFRSTGRYALIAFHSDDSVRATGFRTNFFFMS